MVKDMAEYRISMSTTKNNDSINAMGFVSSLPPNPQPANKLQKLKVDSKTKIIGTFTLQKGARGGTVG